MRTSALGLKPGTPVRVKNACSKKHARGTFRRMVSDTLAEYRSAYNGCLFLTPVTNVRINLSLKRQQRTFMEAAR